MGNVGRNRLWCVVHCKYTVHLCAHICVRVSLDIKLHLAAENEQERQEIIINTKKVVGFL